jgi:hypothetical protein
MASLTLITQKTNQCRPVRLSAADKPAKFVRTADIGGRGAKVPAARLAMSAYINAGRGLPQINTRPSIYALAFIRASTERHGGVLLRFLPEARIPSSGPRAHLRRAGTTANSAALSDRVANPERPGTVPSQSPQPHYPRRDRARSGPCSFGLGSRGWGHALILACAI